MSMKVNKVLPLPAELKEEYPLSEEPVSYTHLTLPTNREV